MLNTGVAETAWKPIKLMLGNSSFSPKVDQNPGSPDNYKIFLSKAGDENIDNHQVGDIFFNSFTLYSKATIDFCVVLRERSCTGLKNIKIQLNENLHTD